MKKALVIIDMQWYFETARERWLISNILEKIDEYINNNLPIIIVEYVDIYEPELLETISEISDKIKNYDNSFIVHKENDDGGYEIESTIKRNCLSSLSELEICGVNLTCCVLDTVATLSELLIGTCIKVIKKCCNNPPKYKYSDEYLIEMYSEIAEEVQLI